MSDPRSYLEALTAITADPAGPFTMFRSAAVAAAEVDTAEAALGFVFPAAYRQFVCEVGTFGFQHRNQNRWHVLLGPSEIVAATAKLRAYVDRLEDVAGDLATDAIVFFAIDPLQPDLAAFRMSSPGGAEVHRLYHDELDWNETPKSFWGLLEWSADYVRDAHKELSTR